MPKSTVVLVLVAFLLTGLVVPTGASGSDELWEEPSVVLEPHDSPNGRYASINADGELEVDFSSTGVNADAITEVSDVFYVTNHHEEPVAIWFSHAAMDEVVLSIDGQPAQSQNDAVELASGEQASVGVTIDSSSTSAGEQVLSEFTIHAEDRSTGDSTGGGSSGGASSGTSDESSDDTELPQSSGEDEIVFADGADSTVEIRPLPLDQIPTTDSDAPPRPAIDVGPAPRALAAEDSQLARADNGDPVVEAGTDLTLTGERTVLSSAEAVQPDGRVLRLVEIDAPAHRQDEPAFVRLAVDRSSLAGTDPTKARIGRHTDDGWQLLDTSVIDADGERVVLQARTPGLNTFAVFADPAVSYQWELPNGRTVDALASEEQFDEPGLHEVTLRVTDGQGRSATTDYRVLVNDQPTVTIESPSSIPDGEPVTLRANVTNEIGNATVTWQFADGTTADGQSVERTFEAGEHVVSVTVVDEYGASGESSVRLAANEAAQNGQVSIELFQLSLSVEERLVYAAILLFLLIAGLRELSARRRRVRVR